ncbi:MAG: hypothetical protein LH702_30360 [Phormidesmis sp. CAN_BIN44]|nr:hypothetical protein [Phormidesmis sp. CAN_BIN44]
MKYKSPTIKRGTQSFSEGFHLTISEGAWISLLKALLTFALIATQNQNLLGELKIIPSIAPQHDQFLRKF